MSIKIDDDSPKRIGVDIDLETYLRSLKLIDYRLRAPVVRAMYEDLLNMLERSNDRRMTIAAIISGYIKLALSGKDNDLLNIVRELATCQHCDDEIDNETKIIDLINRARAEVRKLDGVAEMANETGSDQTTLAPSQS